MENKTDYPEFRKAMSLLDGRVDCEINHPDYGWIPTTLAATDDPDFLAHVKATGPLKAYVPPPVSTDPRDYPLSPRQFNRFAALHGYDDAIDAVLAALKATDRATYATIKGDVMGAGQFRFANVLAIIGNPAIAAVIPQGVDVTEAILTTRWMEAKNT